MAYFHLHGLFMAQKAFRNFKSVFWRYEAPVATMFPVVVVLVTISKVYIWTLNIQMIHLFMDIAGTHLVGVLNKMDKSASLQLNFNFANIGR